VSSPKPGLTAFASVTRSSQSKLDYILHHATLFFPDFGLTMPLSDSLVDTRCAKVLTALLTVLRCLYRQTLTEPTSLSFTS